MYIRSALEKGENHLSALIILYYKDQNRSQKSSKKVYKKNKYKNKK